MKISMEFELPAKIRKKGKWFISSCPLLDVHSQGYTRDEAERNLIDALTSFLVSCYERGTLDSVLRESGVVSVAGAGKARGPTMPRGSKAIRVPIPLAVRRKSRRALAS